MQPNQLVTKRFRKSDVNFTVEVNMTEFAALFDVELRSIHAGRIA